MMREVCIVSAVRTPIGRASKGSLRNSRPDDLAAIVVKSAIQRAHISVTDVDDVVLGCAQPEFEQGLNIARIASLLAGDGNAPPGVTVNRFCASGLEAIANAAFRIGSGSADIIVAGGVESMSMVDFLGESTRPNPVLMNTKTYLGMGFCVEQLANKYGITRQDADEYSVLSHERALEAINNGKFDEEVVPVEIIEVTESGTSVSLFSRDECPRPGTTFDKLSALKPAFTPDGQITAGNASQKSDGAAAVVLMSRTTADELGLDVMLKFRGYSVASTAPEDFGIGPALAVPKLLNQTGINLNEIDLIEFNEAFAAQVLCSQRKYPLKLERMNVLGGAIALGHPLGCTGARQVVTLAHEMRRNGSRYGIVTMCAALGMGAAGLFER